MSPGPGASATEDGRQANPNVPIRDASTVIVLREREARLETFMLCRHGKSGFMGGAHVFPGGKVDAADCDPGWSKRIDCNGAELTAAWGDPGAPADHATGLWVAGIRETLEEAGLLLATTAQKIDLAEARTRLDSERDFRGLVGDLDAILPTRQLVPYARWVTPTVERYRFDTRFFLARAPEGQEASHDGTETVSAIWIAPSAALDQMHEGRIKLAPPTVRTLQWLAGFDTIASSMQDARSRIPPLVRPEIVAGRTGWFLALPGDPDHSESEAVLPGATRMVLEGNAWVDAPMPVP